jgi:hypothetical protein
MGYVPKRNVLKDFLLIKVYFPNFCKQIYFEPFLKHSLVTTVFDLNFGALKIKILNYTKTHFFQFCQKFVQAIDEVEHFFCQFPNPWALRVSGMGFYTSKCEKNTKSLHPIVHNDLGRRWGYV